MTLRTRVLLLRTADLAAAGVLLLAMGEHGTAGVLWDCAAAFLICGLWAVPRSPALRCPGCGRPLGYSVYVRSACRRCKFRFLDWRG